MLHFNPLQFYVMTRYRMDYLFGGFTEYAAEIAAQVPILQKVSSCNYKYL
jgi:hypothetical protein